MPLPSITTPTPLTGALPKPPLASKPIGTPAAKLPAAAGAAQTASPNPALQQLFRGLPAPSVDLQGRPIPAGPGPKLPVDNHARSFDTRQLGPQPTVLDELKQKPQQPQTGMVPGFGHPTTPPKELPLWAQMLADGAGGAIRGALAFPPNVARVGIGAGTYGLSNGLAAIGGPVAQLLGGTEAREAFQGNLRNMGRAGTADASRALSGMFGAGDPGKGAPPHVVQERSKDIARMRAESPGSVLPDIAQFAGDTSEAAGELAADVANVGWPGGGALALSKLKSVPQTLLSNWRNSGLLGKGYQAADAGLNAAYLPKSYYGLSSPPNAPAEAPAAASAAAAPQPLPANTAGETQQAATAAPGSTGPGAAAQPSMEAAVQTVQSAGQNGELQQALNDVNSPEATQTQVKAVSNIAKETGASPEQAQAWYDQMSTPEKLLIGLGLGLSTIAMLGGGEGAGKWLATILGLLTAGGAAAHSGVMGEGAQDFVRGLVGNQFGAPEAKPGLQDSIQGSLLQGFANAPQPMQQEMFKLLPEDVRNQLSQGADITGDGLMGYVPDEVAYNRAARYGLPQESAKQLFDAVRRAKAPVSAGP